MYRKKNGCSAEYSNSSLHCQGKRTFPCPTPTVSANVPGDEDDHQAPLESEPESSSFRPCPHRSESQPSPKAPTQQGPRLHILLTLTCPLLRVQSRPLWSRAWNVTEGSSESRLPMSIHPIHDWQMNFLRYHKVTRLTPCGSAMSYLNSVSLISKI